jgi:DNA-binding Lrp family transcriptional regulator
LLVHDLALRRTILEAMADDCALAILKGTTTKACSAMEIIHQYRLAPSSVYRRISEFVDSGVLTIERIVVTEDGKKYSLYRSTIREIRAEYKGGELELSVSPNEDVVSKLTRMWSTMRVEK